MQILGQIRGFLKYVKYNIFCDFSYCPYFFSILSTSEIAALAHTLNGSNDVFPRNRGFLVSEWKVTPFGRNMPQKQNVRE